MTEPEKINCLISDTSDVTLVVTACNRPDLLLRTLDTFFEFNTYPLKKVIITEDSGIPNVNGTIKKKYPNFTYVDGEKNVGQIKSIDRAYALVDTSYIFHLEDDWETYKSNFIELSRDILIRNPRVSAVMCISHGLKYDLDKEKPPFLLSGKPMWGFYSFNPGLRRLSDYKRVFQGEFSKFAVFNRKKPNESEMAINRRFKKKKFRMAILPDPEGYIRHIGDGRHVIASK